MKQRNAKGKSNTLLWTIALAAVFIAAVGGAFLLQKGTADGKVARVYQDGVLIREIDLSSIISSYEFTVDTKLGTNTIKVRNGGICVSEANCSDQTCVNQGWLSGGSTPIVCLPHKLIIRLEAPDSFAALDAVAG